MGYLAYVISLILTALQNTKGLTFTQGVKMFLDTAVIVNEVLFCIAVAAFVLILVVSIIIFRDDLSNSGGGMGCAMYLFILAALQGIVWGISAGMASAFGPNGITDPTKFWIFVALAILLGSG